MDYYNIITEYILVFKFINRMNTKTLQLLMHLRENSREKLTTISKKTNIPISTLFDLLKELQEETITKSTVLLNFPSLGYHTRAKVFLKVSNENKEKLKQHLRLNSNVNTIFKINNNWSFLIETIHKNIKDLDGFLEKLEGEYKIENKEIHYLIDDVKREGFVVD
jgi:DNA-binding Lrp family transcriptional regulator